MNRTSLVVGTLVATLAASSAEAFERGERCALKAPLQITVKTSSGTVEAVLEKGTDVEVTFAGEGGLTRIQAGETNGAVNTVDLEAACAGTLKLCHLKKQITMFQQNRSDSRSWLVKAGADVSILKQGKAWAAVRVGDLQGFVPSPDMAGACAFSGTNVTVDDAGGASNSPDAPVEEIDRGEGPGVIVLPFSLEGNAPAGAADGYWQILWERTAYYRPDAGRVEDDGARKLAWKAFVDHGIQRAKNADTRYVIVGRLFVEPPAKATADTAPAEGYVVQLAVVDSKSGKVLKGIRVKPSMRADDNWADLALSHLLPTMAGAPGSRTPEPTGTRTLELAPNVRDEKPTSNAPIQEGESAPWFANPFGYVALGVTVAAGTAGGVLAALSMSDNTAANDTPVTDAARTELRSSALVKGASADGLGVVAVAAAVTTVVVFATRAGLE